MLSSIISLISPFVEIFKNIAALIMSVTMVFTSSASHMIAEPIKAENESALKLTFSAIGDSQVNAFTGNVKYFNDVVYDMSVGDTRQDALVIAGDITENSLNEEWKAVYSLLKQSNPADNYVFATGNHDIRLRSHGQVVDTFTSYYNDFTGMDIDEIHYSVEIKGYTFVVIGSDEESLEKQVISDEQLQWIDETVSEATSEGKPVFVVCHQPLKDTHGLPELWNDGKTDSGYIGEQSDELYEILNKYDNVIMISGHLHTGFGQYTYQEVGNIHSVNVPAIGMQNADGTYCSFSIGYTVEVYENEVLFRARDFGTGSYVPEYNFSVPII